MKVKLYTENGGTYSAKVTGKKTPAQVAQQLISKYAQGQAYTTELKV